MPLQKLCLSCGDTKPVEAFAKNKAKGDGLQYRCRSCCGMYRAQNKEKILEQKRLYYIKNRERILDEKRKLYPAVAESKREYQRTYFEKNSEQVLKRHKAYMNSKPDYYRLFREKNPAKVNAKEVRRKTGKANRTPAWLSVDDHWMIEEAYDLAAIRSKLFGFKWHVDHKIPLFGKLISGLHVPTNLQVIPATANLLKSNKYEV